MLVGSTLRSDLMPASMRPLLPFACLAFALSSAQLLAQDAPSAAEPQRSAPKALPILSTVPEARDVAWTAGPMTLDVDATDTTRRIIRVKQTIPVTGAGPLTLLFPEWIPGHHAPRGQIEKLAGLEISAGGKLKCNATLTFRHTAFPNAELRGHMEAMAKRIGFPEQAMTHE